MSENQNFRSAFNGFNREDVVRYIEYIHNQHNARVAQLQSENAELRLQLAEAQAVEVPDTSDLEHRLQASEDCCAALREELALTQAALAKANAALAAAQAVPKTPQQTVDELEAYRRAERTERLAQERADQLCAQANAVLAEATTMVDQAAAQIGTMANDIASQMNQFRDAVIGTKSVLADAAASMYAIRPRSDK